MSRSKRTELLDVLGEVKTRVQDNLGIVDFPMPQFVLIGGQSVGKSRLVETFAGEHFNYCSSTLGSRRPTVLEFRNIASATQSKWSIWSNDTNQWAYQPMNEILKILAESHSSLGTTVSSESINVRIESNACVDMQIVDLPGYRGFAQDEAQRSLAEQIEVLNGGYLRDSRNVILCVEEAGDAANLASLRRVMECDPQFRRTVLIRNKLDKYYGDLNNDNVNQWLQGYGDLPKELKKFALTLPHWRDGQEPSKSLSVLRDEASKQDIETLTKIGTGKMFLDMVGFDNFVRYMETRIEVMFVEAIGPVLQKLRELESAMMGREAELKEELETSDPTQVLTTVRNVGISFAACLSHVMEGYIRSDINRMTLDDELMAFHRHHEGLGDTDTFLGKPSDDFGSVEDYIEYLRDHMQVPAFEVAINGGAQYRRLMFEVETFLRFSEIGIETKKRDVLQSFGISMNSITWREVIVKLLNHDAHLPLQKRVSYVGRRIKWFFEQQKDPIVHFMKSLKGSPDEKLYNVLYVKHAKLIEENQTLRNLVYNTYDTVVERQLNQFIELFKSTLNATFSNPWVFLKKTSAKLEDGDLEEEVLLPSLDDTKQRIPQEIQSRTGVERLVSRRIYDIPLEPHKIDDAVDQVQLMVLKVYSHIRSQICDQVELFAESFFKLPLMRRLEEDMCKIELSKVDIEGYRCRREKMDGELLATSSALHEVQACLATLSGFALKHMSSKSMK